MKLFKTTTLALASVLAVLPAVAQQPDLEEYTDTLAKAKAKGVLFACAYPYTYPFAQIGSNPPGFDVEIINDLAARAGMRVEMYWVQVRSRASVQRAFRESILANRCDVFLSLGDDGNQDEDMGMDRLVFTKPHMSMAYVLAVQGKAEDKHTIEDLKKAGVKIGVNMSTPADAWLFDNGYDRALYFGEDRLMKGMVDGEIDAALIWGPSFAAARKRYPDAKFHLVGDYVPLPEHRFNMRFAVRKEDESLLDFLNQGIAEMLANGKIKQHVETYKVPYYGPLG
jgi:ABC-type amino acid transport substrate-binding protein